MSETRCPACYGRGVVESVAVTLTCPDCRGCGLVNSSHPGLMENFPLGPGSALGTALRNFDAEMEQRIERDPAVGAEIRRRLRAATTPGADTGGAG